MKAHRDKKIEEDIYSKVRIFASKWKLAMVWNGSTYFSGAPVISFSIHRGLDKRASFIDMQF